MRRCPSSSVLTESIEKGVAKEEIWKSEVCRTANSAEDRLFAHLADKAALEKLKAATRELERMYFSLWPSFEACLAQKEVENDVENEEEGRHKDIGIDGLVAVLLPKQRESECPGN